MSNFSTSIPDPSEDGPKWLRIFWAVLTAVLTISMLIAGGVITMEYATLIFALPVTIIVYLVMFSFSKALKIERAERRAPGKLLQGQRLVDVLRDIAQQLLDGGGMALSRLAGRLRGQKTGEDIDDVL